MNQTSNTSQETPQSKQVQTLLEVLRHRGTTQQVDRAHQIYCNRDINFANIDAIGFDMDYTLAVYTQEAVDRLSVKLTLERLIEHRGYPEDIMNIKPDPDFAIRGLAVDRHRGNILKLDSHRHVGMAYHGFRALTQDELDEYKREAIRFSGDRYALMDTLYALPEAFLYAALVDYCEKNDPAIEGLTWEKLYDDIRFSIDLAHRDGSFKKEIMANTADYIERSELLALTLHRLRSSGKKLFLLTNSYPQYTEHLMTYLLDGMLPEYDNWRQYFEVIVAGASKPRFFTESNPFLLVDDETLEAGEPTEKLERGRMYQHGNLKDFIEWSKIPADRTLYVGDHIYGDILRSRKTSAWRTVMIVQEMASELNQSRALHEDLSYLNEIEDEIARLTQEISQEQWVERNIEPLMEQLHNEAAQQPENAPDCISPEELAKLATKELRHSKDRMRRRRKELLKSLLDAEQRVQRHFNPWWGLIFKMNNKNSIFGEQVEDYACLYTSKVSNFVNYSPMHYFRAPRQPMPHEIF